MDQFAGEVVSREERKMEERKREEKNSKTWKEY
jgi:hypothetical protein